MRSGDAAPAADGSHRRRREAPRSVGRHYDRSQGREGRQSDRGTAAGLKRGEPSAGLDANVREQPRLSRRREFVDGASAPPSHRWPEHGKGKPKIAAAGARKAPTNADCPLGTSRAPATPRILSEVERRKDQNSMHMHRENAGSRHSPRSDAHMHRVHRENADPHHLSLSPRRRGPRSQSMTASKDDAPGSPPARGKRRECRDFPSPFAGGCRAKRGEWGQS